MKTFSKIEVIMVLRANIPDLGLADAKNMVDKFESRNFENRVVAALGVEAREELYTWARLNAAYLSNQPYVDSEYDSSANDWDHSDHIDSDAYGDPY